MLQFTKKRIGDILVESGFLTTEQLNECLEEQSKSHKKLGQIFIEKGFLTEQLMAEVLEFHLGIPFVNLEAYSIDSKIVHMIAENMAKKHELIAIKFENNVLTVAVSEPLNVNVLNDLKIFTGHEIYTVMANATQINNLITRHYSSLKAMDAVKEFNKSNQITSKDLHQEETDVNESPAVKLINVLIEQAIESGASDIHIEPQSMNTRIRFRIDGQLQEIMKCDLTILPSIISRIKVIAGLNIAEKRLPQDGRIEYKMEDHDVDLRISFLPSIFGEKLVMRLISKSTFDIPKEKLGFLTENLERFNSILKNPHGIILVTGPTGSGKTTTLYTAIKDLNKPNVNIITVEDPVESPIDGITQVAVNFKTGLNFATSLRSILRQDPDIVLVGEIRDTETAEIAVRTAITGHLVLSTLHTNDSASSIARLIDMEIPPFLVATSLVGVVAQRLVRCICKNCKTSYKPPDEELQLFNLSVNEKPSFYKGTGCKICKNTGYKGRVAVHEIMILKNDIRQAIYRTASADEIRNIAIKGGMISLKENCERLVLQGITTYEEMLKVAYIQE